jgi:GNAT superfamily N-acetyltransferase
VITIRLAKAEEWNILQKLNNEVFIDNYAYDPDLKMDWATSEAGEMYFKNLLANQNACCFIAEDDGKPIGYIAGAPKSIHYRKSRYFEIENMGVNPEYRSQGIGAKLIETCEKWAKDQGFQKLYVSSYFKNTKAIMFYKKSGFAEIATDLEKNI